MHERRPCHAAQRGRTPDSSLRNSYDGVTTRHTPPLVEHAPVRYGTARTRITSLLQIQIHFGAIVARHAPLFRSSSSSSSPVAEVAVARARSCPLALAILRHGLSPLSRATSVSSRLSRFSCRLPVSLRIRRAARLRARRKKSLYPRLVDSIRR